MPTEVNSVISKGEAHMNMLDQLGLQRIQLRLLPAKIMYDHYLRRHPMSIDFLCL